ARWTTRCSITWSLDWALAWRPSQFSLAGWGDFAQALSTIVDAGSGCAEMAPLGENRMHHQYHLLDWICVDPQPLREARSRVQRRLKAPSAASHRMARRRHRAHHRGGRGQVLARYDAVGLVQNLEHAACGRLRRIFLVSGALAPAEFRPALLAA